jgi:hypothetical protein
VLAIGSMQRLPAASAIAGPPTFNPPEWGILALRHPRMIQRWVLAGQTGSLAAGISRPRFAAHGLSLASRTTCVISVPVHRLPSVSGLRHPPTVSGELQSSGYSVMKSFAPARKSIVSVTSRIHETVTSARDSRMQRRQSAPIQNWLIVWKSASIGALRPRDKQPF